MNPKNVVDIPVLLISVFFIAGVTNVINISPLLIFLSWVLISISSIFLILANVINGGYKNDQHRNFLSGNTWRESSIASALLLGLISILIGQALWTETGITNVWIIIDSIILSLIFSYFNTKFRYKVFRQLTPKEKEAGIKISEFKKYIKWYTWIILLIYLVILLSYIS